MLPNRVKQFLLSLLEKTERGEFKWASDPDSSSVYIQNENFQVTIQYSFNTITESGEYFIFYYDFTNNSKATFSTDDTYNDYSVVRRLFDVAQASGMQFPF